MSAQPEAAPRPPDAVYVRARWIKYEVQKWVEQCNKILLEYGRVDGSVPCRTRTQARYKARKLRGLMVDLRMHESWQLVEHTWHTPDGWMWCLEYHPPREAKVK